MSVSTAAWDLVIIGGGVGGCAAALAATEAGLRVVMTEPTRWIGGQLTSQATPPDENPWIATYGGTASYQRLRELTRRYYRESYALTPQALADPTLNPGGGFVSHLCVLPRAGLFALEQMLGPAIAQGRLTVLLQHEPVAAETDGDRVTSVTVRNIASGEERTLAAPMIVDATEAGDLLDLADVEHVTGTESQGETGEPHAPAAADPTNVQASTWVFAMAHDPRPGADHVGEPPADYDAWRAYVPELRPPWPGPLLGWLGVHPATLKLRRYGLLTDAPDVPDMLDYRKVLRPEILVDKSVHPVTMVNWPQNDYLNLDIATTTGDTKARAVHEARQLSLSLLHWMQTEASRSDGGVGFPGLYLVPDVTGTDDGLAMAPYIREARRIRARLTVTELHVGLEARGGPALLPGELPPGGVDAMPTAEPFPDSVGIGAYRIDLHPTVGGDNYLDLASLPFQIPLRALVPVRVQNLLPACKNIGTTHITNGCYRLHPVEWNIGEAVGTLAAFCRDRGCAPGDVCDQSALLSDFQTALTTRGVRLSWGPCRPL